MATVFAGRTIAVVMPAYNEAKLIGEALECIPSFVDHIIVVDDASIDDTAAIARGAGRRIELVAHGTNQGVGAAIVTGCQRAFLRGADLTAVMAADGQMDPVDLPALLVPLITEDADYVKGNRLDWPGVSEAMPRHRWLGNHVFSWLTRRAIGVDMQDSQCGYVAMNRLTQRVLDWDRLWKGYGYPNDLLSWLAVRGLRVQEVKVRPVYGLEQSGIRLRHVMLTIPFVIARAWVRRVVQVA